LEADKTTTTTTICVRGKSSKIAAKKRGAFVAVSYNNTLKLLQNHSTTHGHSKITKVRKVVVNFY